MDEHKRERTEITIETVSVTRIRTRGGRGREAYCDSCRQNSSPIDETHAMVILGGDRQTLDGGLIHRLIGTDICGNSLAENLARRSR